MFASMVVVISLEPPGNQC